MRSTAAAILSDLRENELAALSGYSPSASSRAFRRHTGTAFVQYVSEMRINSAREVLMTSTDSIADICYQVGFNNLSNFNRQFLARKRMPPSEFRGQHRQNLTFHNCSAVPPTP